MQKKIAQSIFVKAFPSQLSLILSKVRRYICDIYDHHHHRYCHLPSNKQLKLENAIHQNGGKINEEQKQRFEKSNRNKKHTEKRCRKLKMGKIPYSPETAKAQVTKEL